ncbi:MAG: Kelch repeat-containing protein [Candidatus Bathyarchaeia archaeon]
MNKTLTTVVVLATVISLLVSFFLSIAFVSASAAEGTWTEMAPMQEARGDLGVAVVNGKIYAIGGSTIQYFYQYGVLRNLTGEYVGTNEEYDPATDTWTYKSSMPTSRSGFAIAVYQNKIYCIGGYTNGPPSKTYLIGMTPNQTSANEVYDPSTDTWETMTPTPVPIAYSVANTVEDKVYITSSSSNGTINVYDPTTDTWTTKTSNPMTAEACCSTVLDNKLHYIQGASNPEDKFHQVYDPQTDSWSQKMPPPVITAYGVAAATTGVNAPKQIYILHFNYESANAAAQGGTNYAASIATSVYTIANDTWTTGASPPTYRQGGYGVAIVDDCLYVIGGYTAAEDYFLVTDNLTQYATNEMYTPFGYRTPTSETPPITATTNIVQSTVTTTLVIALAVSIAAVAICAVIYFKKRHRGS